MTSLNPLSVYAPDGRTVIGHSLLPREFAEPMPKGFEGVLATAIAAGKAFSRRLFTMNGATQSLDFGSRAVQLATRPYPTIHRQDGPWRDVFKSVFWAAAAQEAALVYEASPADLVIFQPLFGAQSQRTLTRALLGLDEDDRRSIHTIYKRWSNDDDAWWVRDFAGAIAVARTVVALRDLHLDPILPTPFVDSAYKIDLVAQASRDPGWFLCLQVKSDRTAPSQLHVVDLENGSYEPCERARVQAGVWRLMRKASLTRATAAILYVSAQGQAPWTLAPPEGLPQLLLAIPCG